MANGRDDQDAQSRCTGRWEHQGTRKVFFIAAFTKSSLKTVSHWFASMEPAAPMMKTQVSLGGRPAIPMTDLVSLSSFSMKSSPAGGGVAASPALPIGDAGGLTVEAAAAGPIERNVEGVGLIIIVSVAQCGHEG